LRVSATEQFGSLLLRSSGHPQALAQGRRLHRLVAPAHRHGGWRRATTTFPSADGRTLHLRRTTRAEPSRLAVYGALGIDPEVVGTRRTIIRTDPELPGCSATNADSDIARR